MSKASRQYHGPVSVILRQAMLAFMLVCVSFSVVPELFFDVESISWIGELEEEKHEDSEKESEYEGESFITWSATPEVVHKVKEKCGVVKQDTRTSLGREILAPPPDAIG